MLLDHAPTHRGRDWRRRLRRLAPVVVLALVAASGEGCGSRPEHPFLSRPAAPRDGGPELAFTARGRVWIATPGGKAGAPRAPTGPRPGGGAAGAAGAPAASGAPGTRGTPGMTPPAAGAPAPRRWVARPLGTGVAARAEAATPGSPVSPASPSARGVPFAPGHQDRPVWFPDGDSLALSIWVDGRADIAIASASAAGGTVRNLTRSPDRDELLDDISPDGARLVFESDHDLWEHRLATGEARRLVRGRDARYTADGRRLLFVRGHTVSALGIWREGYRGGDTSEIMLLDLESGDVRAVTDNNFNDEHPIPLDLSGERFLAASERTGHYQLWFVDPAGERVRRVRRPKLPGLERPVRFPALRPHPQGGLELWMEYEGDLYRTRVVKTDSTLSTDPPERAVVELLDPAPPASRGLLRRLVDRVRRRSGDAPGWYGAALYESAQHELARSPLTAAAWRGLPDDLKRRLRREMTRAHTRRAAVEILSRLLGRFGLSHLYYEPEWGPLPVPPVAGPEARAALGAALRKHGLDYLALDRLDRAAVEALAGLAGARDAGPMAGPPAPPLVLDLRDTRGGHAHDALLLMLCGEPYDPDRAGAAAQLAGGVQLSRPVVALVSEHTVSSGEILADGIQALGCGHLVGRPTAGAVLAARARSIETGGRLFVPFARPARRTGGAFEGTPVMPNLYTPPAIDPADEDWLAVTLGAASRARARPERSTRGS